MKKILIFSLDYYPEPVGGAEVAIKEITDRVDPADADIEFHMITLIYDNTLPRAERVGNVFVHRIGWGRVRPPIQKLKDFPFYDKAVFQFLAAFKALSLHRRHRYDAIWAMMAHSTGVPAALFKLMHPRVPYILTLQEGDPPEHIEHVMRPLWPLFSRAFTSADIVQAISGFLADWARRRRFRGPLEIIPNGSSVDLRQSYSEKELEAYRKKVGKKEGNVFIITVSRLVYKNAVDDLIRALALLPGRIRLLIVGGGPEENRLRELTEELGVSSRVVFTGQVDRTETARYRAISDIFARPSRSEGFGNSFASAMASRLPIIGTQEEGIADFLFDEKRNPERKMTGWVVDKDSPEQIAEAVTDILAHPEKAKRVADTSYKLVAEKYNWDFIAREMQEKIFGRVL